MTRRSAYAAGNWKMHGTGGNLNEIAAIAQAAKSALGQTTLLCLPATLVDRARNSGIAIGGQDCHASETGAHTGDTSAAMLSDAGATFVIVGHSERREGHGEDNDIVAAKAQAAWAAGLTSIICIGETESEYRAGEKLSVLKAQIAGSLPEGASTENTVIAYEPVWAIGTALTPTVEEIKATHQAIRADISEKVSGGEEISILYGGSVNPANAAEIFALNDVDGGLVGGASLTANDFIPIIQALAHAKGGA